MSDLRFYLGTHRPTWLWELTDVPLFVSHRRLRERVSRFPTATTRWALDSGGFTELSMFGKWETTPEQYVASVYRYRDELGSLDWASPQDWMVEPWMLEKTGLTVDEHQHRTIENYLTLCDLAPDLPFIPVLQGWALTDYLTHAQAYEAAGVDLRAQPVVGVGSVCRRQQTGQIAGVFDALSGLGLRMHGFGVKAGGFGLYADNLSSADSLAWSYGARREARAGGPTCGKKSCANCLHYALSWRDRVLRSLDTRQLTLPLYTWPERPAMVTLTRYTLRNPALRHQVVFQTGPGGADPVQVSCNCRRRVSGSYDPMGSGRTLDEARARYNDPNNHWTPFNPECDLAKW